MQVPGTCTSVRWERMQNRNLTSGTPQVGYIDMNGKLTENQHLNPDYVVDNDPAVEANGRSNAAKRLTSSTVPASWLSRPMTAISAPISWSVMATETV